MLGILDSIAAVLGIIVSCITIRRHIISYYRRKSSKASPHQRTAKGIIGAADKKPVEPLPLYLSGVVDAYTKIIRARAQPQSPEKLKQADAALRQHFEQAETYLASRNKDIVNLRHVYELAKRTKEQKLIEPTKKLLIETVVYYAALTCGKPAQKTAAEKEKEQKQLSELEQKVLAELLQLRRGDRQLAVIVELNKRRGGIKATEDAKGVRGTTMLNAVYYGCMRVDGITMRDAQVAAARVRVIEANKGGNASQIREARERYIEAVSRYASTNITGDEDILLGMAEGREEIPQWESDAGIKAEIANVMWEVARVRYARLPKAEEDSLKQLRQAVETARVKLWEKEGFTRENGKTFTEAMVNYVRSGETPDRFKQKATI